MAGTLALPFKLIRPDSSTPVTTADAITDSNQSNRTQQEINTDLYAKIEQGGSGGTVTVDDTRTLTVLATEAVVQYTIELYSMIRVVGSKTDSSSPLTAVILPSHGGSNTKGWLIHYQGGWRIVTVAYTISTDTTFESLLPRLCMDGLSLPIENLKITTTSYTASNVTLTDKDSTEFTSINGATTDTAGVMTANQVYRLNRLYNATYPWTIASTPNPSAGNYEVGDSITPGATIVVKDSEGTTVDSANYTIAAPSGCVSTVGGNTWYSLSKISSGNNSYVAKVTYNGETKSASAVNYNFMNYIYFGTLDSVPTDYAAAIKALTGKQLSKATTLETTSLAANKYYLFAVPGDVTLVCRHASTKGIIGGCVTGNDATIPQENYATTALSNKYSYILVPASTSAWEFVITNS